MLCAMPIISCLHAAFSRLAHVGATLFLRDRRNMQQYTVNVDGNPPLRRSRIAEHEMKDWHPDLSRSSSPRYMAIADLIEMDLRSGVLAVGTGYRRSASWQSASASISPQWRAVMWKHRSAAWWISHVGRGTFVTGGQDRERRGFRLRCGARSAPRLRRRLLDEPAAGAG